MRAPSTLIAATALASALLTFAGTFSPADARMTLNQCISNRSACRSACFAAQGPAGKPFPWTLEFQNCLNHCNDNHAACVDFVMGGIAVQSTAGSSKPPKPGVFDGGLLGTSHDLSTQGPTGAGSPLSAPAAPASPASATIR
jgi:hypothetical protein